MSSPFDFLAPLVELEDKINELKHLGESTGMDMSSELESLDRKFEDETRRIFAVLSPWQRVQLARHPLRPQTSDYIDLMVEDFVPLAGDRSFADDEAVVCGLGRVGTHDCMVIGQQKGKDVHERRRCNFGSPHPEGYRKAMLKMRLAEKFGLPVISLINTPGAFPGIEAEERGQSLAIAENIRDMARLRTPVVVVIIGEGGSGGALGIGVGDRMLVLENSYYSVISPEGCAAILWRDAAKAPVAAEAMKITATSLIELGICDEVIREPAGGAHRNPEAMAGILGAAIGRQLDALGALSMDELLDQRYAKYRAIGAFRSAC
ncbi:MAG: acetyl-CoA carboxylase carboxyltransferase subunit alpha [Planctomycetota bacterium]